MDAQAIDVDRSRRAAEESVRATVAVATGTSKVASAAERSAGIAAKSQFTNEKLVANAEANFREDRRPYLQVDPHTETHPRQEQTNFTVTNFGRTPAYRIRSSSIEEYGHYDVGAGLSYKFVRDGVVGPPTSIGDYMYPLLPDNAMAAGVALDGPGLELAKQLKVVRILHTVDYYDLHKTKYSLQVCYESNPRVAHRK
jgi:hypothetical protein